MSSDLDRAVQTVVRRCLAVQPGEDVLVIGDEGTYDLAEALRAEASAAGADAVIALMDARAENGTEPPPAIAAALAAVDVYIAPTTKSLSHTKARKTASEAGARGATLPGVTAELLARVMTVDFDTMAARSAAVAELLTRADEARVTCAAGTDLRLDLTGRTGLVDDGILTQPGVFGNLPCGEGFIAPLSGEGVAMVTSFDGAIARDPEPLVLEGGHLVRADGEHGSALLARLRAHGPDGTNLAELGVGTNDRAIVTGNVLEDEKILGSVHIAFGASMGIGGTVSVPIHQDVTILDVTLDLGDTRVLDAGRYVLD
jgi:leucyl aminopeptidase (aminopeptidase T)